MGENIQAIDMKKERLKRIISRGDYAYKKKELKQIQESIERHKRIAESIRRKRQKNERRKR